MHRNAILAALAAATALAAIPTAAGAQAYAQGGWGLSNPNKTVVRMDRDRLRVDSDLGLEFNAAVGYKLGPVSIEVEGVRSISSNRSIRNNTEYYRVERSRNVSLGMANLLLNLPVTKRLSLFAGGGAGYGRVQFRAAEGRPCRERLAVRTTKTDASPRTSDTGGTCTDQGLNGDGDFAYQGLAGLDYNVGGGWAVGLRGRYSTVTSINTAAKSVPTRQTQFTTNRDYTQQGVTMTLRHYF